MKIGNTSYLLPVADELTAVYSAGARHGSAMTRMTREYRNYRHFEASSDIEFHN